MLFQEKEAIIESKRVNKKREKKEEKKNDNNKIEKKIERATVNQYQRDRCAKSQITWRDSS